jgi:hypothetical protein
MCCSSATIFAGSAFWTAGFGAAAFFVDFFAAIGGNSFPLWKTAPHRGRREPAPLLVRKGAHTSTQFFMERESYGNPLNAYGAKAAAIIALPVAPAVKDGSSFESECDMASVLVASFKSPTAGASQVIDVV